MMAEVPGLPVKGYAATQSQAAIDQVNKLKVLEERFLRELDAMMTLSDPHEGYTYDGRWISIAKTHIQQGTMAAARAVFQPQRITGDLD